MITKTFVVINYVIIKIRNGILLLDKLNGNNKRVNENNYFYNN